MSPSSLTKVHLSVWWSVRYGALPAADDGASPALLFSSMKTSKMKLLMTEALTGAYVRDHSTTPDVVRISKVSSIAQRIGGDLLCSFQDAKLAECCGGKLYSPYAVRCDSSSCRGR